MRRASIFLLFLFLSLQFGCGSGDKTRELEKQEPKEVKVMNFRYGDDFSGFTIRFLEEEPEDHHDYKMVAYGDSGCKACVDNFSKLSLLYSIFKEEFDFRFYWRLDIPSNLLEDYSIPREINGVVEEGTMLHAGIPAYYIIDKNKKVEFVTGDISELVEKIFLEDLVNKEELRVRLNQAFLSKYGKDKKPILVFFAMEGCSDCEKVQPLICSKEIADKYTVLPIYRDNGDEDDKLRDFMSLYAKTYDIKWFPSFLVIEDAYRYTIIGETAIEDLKENLLSR